MNRDTVLITGGSGLIGSNLVIRLAEKGYNIRVLSRTKLAVGGAELFLWDVDSGFIEEGALNGVDHIVHLAGTNIGEGRWSSGRKKSIIDSRVKSARILLKVIADKELNIKSFISSSAIGYYGAISSDHIYTEEDRPGTDFNAQVCIEWEKAAAKFHDMGVRTTIIRTGIVLATGGGMLKALMPAVKARFLPLFGNGNQYIPWIHIDDICRIYIKAIEEPGFGPVINGVAPEHVSYRLLIKTISSVLDRKLFSPPIPSVFWKLIVGEKAVILVNGSRISSRLLEKSGYSFKYPELIPALRNLLIP